MKIDGDNTAFGGAFDDTAASQPSLERFGSWSYEFASAGLTTSAACRAMLCGGRTAPFSSDEIKRALEPADLDRARRAFHDSFATGRECNFDVRVRAADGSWRQIALRGQVVADGDGRPLRLTGVAFDVTLDHEARAREAAQEALSRCLRELDEPAEIAYAAAEILGRALGVGRAGYGTIDPVAETITIERDWIAPGVEGAAGVWHFRDFGSYIDDLKRGETVHVADSRLDPRTASTTAMLETAGARAFVNAPVTGHGGLVGLLYVNHAQPREWSLHDLRFIREFAERTAGAVARRLAEIALRTLAASLEEQIFERTRERDSAWDNAQDLLLVLDPDGSVLMANPAWAAMLGRDPGDLVGRPFTTFVHPDDEAASRQAFAGAHAGQLRAFENRLMHRDGTTRSIAWVASVAGDRVYASGRDVTTERLAATRLEEAHANLRQAQKMEAFGQLTGGIAHDFNNLLQTVTGGLEMLGRKHVHQEAGHRLLRLADRAVTRAAHLTQQLLAFARKQPLELKSIEIDRAVATSLDLATRSLPESVIVDRLLDANRWPVLSDANQLDVAILNLVINARDAMPDGGRIVVSTHAVVAPSPALPIDLAPGDYVCLAIADTGTGMSDEVRQRVFEPFFTTKGVGKGTGLGLSQVYGFAHQCGGSVRIASRETGGTTVEIYLPRSRLDEAVEISEHAVTEWRGCETILVVDDDDDVRELASVCLQEFGYRVLQAASGHEALETISREPAIDLLLIDFAMPAMNGAEAVRLARRMRPDLEVLFVTGYADLRAIGEQVDVNTVVQKPFKLAQLVDRVAKALARRLPTVSREPSNPGAAP